MTLALASLVVLFVALGVLAGLVQICAGITASRTQRPQPKCETPRPARLVPFVARA